MTDQCCCINTLSIERYLSSHMSWFLSIIFFLFFAVSEPGAAAAVKKKMSMIVFNSMKLLYIACYIYIAYFFLYCGRAEGMLSE